MYLNWWISKNRKSYLLILTIKFLNLLSRKSVSWYKITYTVIEDFINISHSYFRFSIFAGDSTVLCQIYFYFYNISLVLRCVSVVCHFFCFLNHNRGSPAASLLLNRNRNTPACCSLTYTWKSKWSSSVTILDSYLYMTAVIKGNMFVLSIPDFPFPPILNSKHFIPSLMSLHLSILVLVRSGDRTQTERL